MNSRAALAAARVARSSSRNPQWYWRYSNNGSRRNDNNILGCCDFHSYALSRNNNNNNTDDDDDKRLRRHPQQQVAGAVNHMQNRSFHSTPTSERAVALIFGLTTLSALGYAGSSAVQSYNEWKAAQPSPEELEEQQKKDEAENAKAKAQSTQQEGEAEKKKKSSTSEEAGPRKNIFKEWFGVGEGSYYEGGFDDKMTKKEAALILGVRESSSPQRIKDAHRKLLILNHPDTGGSTFIAGKINEAKELLLKGRRGV